jgi:hypothetical protein
MIKEFDLSADGIEKEKKMQFREETRCITSLFERCYTPSKITGKNWKILVEVVDVIKEPLVRNQLGVLKIQTIGDVISFLQMKPNKKLSATLNYLYSGIEKVAQQK